MLLIVRFSWGRVQAFTGVKAASRRAGYLSYYDAQGAQHNIPLTHVDRAYKYLGVTDSQTGLVRLV